MLNETSYKYKPATVGMKLATFATWCGFIAFVLAAVGSM